MERLLKDENLDLEWVELILTAKNYGYSPKQIRLLLSEIKEKVDKQVEN